MQVTETVGTAEMARRISASPNKVLEMAKAGIIPHVPIGRKLTFVPENVIAALERTSVAEKRAGRSARSRSARRKVF